MTIPSSIATAIVGWQRENSGGSLRNRTQSLSRTYKSGGTSHAADLAAYLATRAPATYAACARAMAEVATAHSGFSPGSLLDVGAGAGSATWAALAQWPSLASVTLADTNLRFLELAQSLASNSGWPALKAARFLPQRIGNAVWPKADLVIASYVLVELPLEQIVPIASELWQATTGTLVLVEPGTPAGFSRINAMRAALLCHGARIAAPCTHEGPCPMVNDDWCHFAVRLPRSRAHMHAKAATVPFEDEPFSFMAASRTACQHSDARIVAPVHDSKHDRAFHLCAANGLRTRNVAARDKTAYKAVRKLEWGDTFPKLPDKDI